MKLKPDGVNQCISFFAVLSFCVLLIQMHILLFICPHAQTDKAVNDLRMADTGSNLKSADFH